MNLILYIIAFLEGFTTLSVEIMAIRNSIAIIGSNAIATSIILGIILLALSYGYYRGGVYAAEHTENEIKRKIFLNLLIASIVYTFVSFPLENTLLQYFLGLDIGYFFPIFLGISLLFILPVFLASQTIPLLSELIHHEKKSIVLGKLLFFSTIGSFLGSVMTSLIFFAYIGVDRSIIINGIILANLAFIIVTVFYRQRSTIFLIYGIGAYIVLLIALFFSDISFSNPQSNISYRQSTEYNDIIIYDNGNRRLFSMNGSNSSGLDKTTGKSFFGYIQDITKIIDDERPKKILIIGAAGFTLPQDIADRDYVEEVHVCDIDGSLDVIAQEHFLQEKLNEKIVFSKESARYFINRKISQGEKYDFIFIDAYNGKISIPSELLTEEFFQSISQISSGPITMNVIMDAGWTSTFAKKLSNTLSQSLKSIYVQGKETVGIVSGFDNFILSTTPSLGYTSLITHPGLPTYTDNLNTLEQDKYRLFYTAQMN